MYGRMRTAQSLHSLLPIKRTPQYVNVKFTEEKFAVCDMVMVRRNADLLEVVAALGAAGRLRGGQEYCNQDGDDRDDNEKLDQRKTV